MLKKIFRPRTIISLIAVMLLMIVAYAYAAANVVPPTGAGDGDNTISGYTVTNVHYTLDAGDPSLIAAVNFTITPSAGAGAVGEVQVQLVTAGPWYACDESGAPAVTCTTTGATVLTADNFRVVAVE